MEHRPDIVDEALAKLERVRDEQLTSLAAGRAAEALYQEVVSMPESTPGKRRGIAPPSRRRRLVLRAGVAALAVVAVAAVLSVANVFGSHGPATVAPAAALDKAAAAVTPQKGVVFHVHMLGSQDNGDGSTASWSSESWSTTSKPVASRMIQSGGTGPSVETAITADGRTPVYDRGTNTIFEGDAAQVDGSPPAFPPDGGGFRATVLELLKSGEARVKGREKIDGRDAIRIVGDGGHATYFVDATTYDPIEFRTTGDGGGTSLRFVAYEQLPATPENLDLTSLTKAHPEAKVDDDPAHWKDAQARLFPNG